MCSTPSYQVHICSISTFANLSCKRCTLNTLHKTEFSWVARIAVFFSSYDTKNLVFFTARTSKHELYSLPRVVIWAHFSISRHSEPYLRVGTGHAARGCTLRHSQTLLKSQLAAKFFSLCSQARNTPSDKKRSHILAKTTDSLYLDFCKCIRSCAV